MGWLNRHRLDLWTQTFVGGNSAAATNFLARTTGLDVTHTSAYIALLNGLTADGFFNANGTSSKLDALYILATQDTVTSLLNLVSSSYALTTSSSPTFAADRGYTGDGVAHFLETGFSPGVAAGNYALNSSSFGAYVRTNVAENANDIGCSETIGGVDFSNSFLNTLSVDATNQFVTINQDSQHPTANPTALGFYVVTRTGVTTAAVYKNGSPFSTATDVSTFLADTGATFNILCRRLVTNGGAPTRDNFSTKQVAAAFIGGGMSATDANNFSLRINSYMTAVGANVF